MEKKYPELYNYDKFLILEENRIYLLTQKKFILSNIAKRLKTKLDNSQNYYKGKVYDAAIRENDELQRINIHLELSALEIEINVKQVVKERLLRDAIADREAYEKELEEASANIEDIVFMAEAIITHDEKILPYYKQNIAAMVQEFKTLPPQNEDLVFFYIQLKSLLTSVDSLDKTL